MLRARITQSRARLPGCFRYLSSGQSLPTIELRLSTPGDKYSLPTKGKQILIGVPAAFSPGCSNSHIPGYLKKAQEFKKAGIDGINIISVNDAFVMKAWADSFSSESTQDVLSSSGGNDGFFKFLADHDGSWISAADVAFDASSILGGHRSKRFAAIIKDGIVQQAFFEPDNTGITVSAAENVLKRL
ncbi:AhpC/TSA family protein [Taphrina deformans PYCC 5710]|uniref:AhpC/TSA family protein n=1 Tax=Taphrina deformans (strain PYCC 5710 / ATCC 11124 / CBS 356.35 / IMI 108563 / JCM 9778 / NBRC 8474) TaxID=1097556 RepID=R4XGP3_TAPDE|nr:AhpC/TSA family protein [Taphrina deformans PYCC 5710]|eukprot:CCG83642.1 AhpC/TSA family protein [Taphrina deformans PYCC 5710]